MGPVGFPTRSELPPWRCRGLLAAVRSDRAVPPLGAGAGAGALPRGRLVFPGADGLAPVAPAPPGLCSEQFPFGSAVPPSPWHPARGAGGAVSTTPVSARTPDHNGPAVAPSTSSAPVPAGKSPFPLLAHQLPQGWGGMAVVPVPIPLRRQRGQRNPKSSCPRCAQLPWGFVTRAPATASPRTPPPLPTTLCCKSRVSHSSPSLGWGSAWGHTLEEGWCRDGDHPCPASWLSPCTGWGLFCCLCSKQLKIASGFLVEHGEHGEHGCLATGWMWFPAPRKCRQCDTARLPAHAGSPWPSPQPSACRAGQDPAPGERWLWNDTITPAEQAAREPSGMSCLSKALSAPPRALRRPLRCQAHVGGPQGRIQPGPTLSGDTRSSKSPWLGRGPGQLLPCGQSAGALV